MNFFKALFGGQEESTEEKKQKEVERNFDVFKYDGIRAIKSGEVSFGIQCLLKALELKDDGESMRTLANAYIAQNELTKAYDLLERLSASEPDNAQVFVDKAQVAFLMKNYQTMNEDCQKAFLLNDKDPLTYFLMARANHAQGDDVSAVGMLTKAITLKKDLYDAYLMRGETLHEMGQNKESEEDADLLLEKMPGQEDALLLKAVIRGEADDIEKALACYDKAIDGNPFCQRAYLMKARLLADHHLSDQAISVLNNAIDLSADFAEAYKLRGEIKRRSGDESGAIEDLKKAIELEPEEEKRISGEFKSIQQETEKQYASANPLGL
jgi:tetratricopeptide (TPR) repeat protein